MEDFTRDIERPALGRIRSLGAAYDARTDSFCNMNLLRSDNPEEAGLIKSFVQTRQLTNILQTNTSEERCDEFGVKAELRLSLMGGMVEVGGSGVLLDSDKKTWSKTSTVVVHTRETRQENLKCEDLKAEDFKTPPENATHVVIGINWGAKLVVNCKEKTSTSSNFERRGLTPLMIKAADMVSAKLELTSLKDIQEVDKEISFDAVSDVIITPPTTTEEALECVKTFPTAVENTNGGKGQPLVYILRPISKISGLSSAGGCLQSTDPTLVQNIVRLKENISTVKKDVIDLSERAKKHDNIIPRDDLEKIDKLKAKCIAFDTTMHVDIGKMTRKVRCREINNSDFTSKLEVDERKIEDLKIELDELLPIFNKIRTYDFLTDHGITYICRYKVAEFNIGSLEKAYILYFHDLDRNSQNEMLRLKQEEERKYKFPLTEPKKYEFYFVDVQMNPVLKPDEAIPCIQKIIDGKVVECKQTKNKRYHAMQALVS